MDWKILGLMLLLFGGVGALLSNIAALFGYSGEFTLVLLPVCVTMAIVTGAAISRRSKSKPPPPYSELSPQYGNYQRQKREGMIRAKWFFFCGFIGFLIFLLASWFCQWMGWPQRICLTAISIAVLGGIQVVGTAIGNKMVKRELNSRP